MIKKIIFFVTAVFLLVLNIVIDININNYITIINDCFNQNIILTPIDYSSICFIIALISILIIIVMKLITNNKKEEIKGINLKTEDGTYGTANWLNENELNSILGKNNVPGIILGKQNTDIIKLPFDSKFNKNITVFGSSGSMKTIRIFNYKFAGTNEIQKIYCCNRCKRRNLQNYKRII
ncbi:MAG: hypothetical protein J6I85_02745 [Clostridia bacterium]|nr:hypothetical protein [Clostridia bacterium]MBP3800939.1 hypothetical protein [Clostridia bacterium]